MAITYFYVKSGGTATGAAGQTDTQRTGSFASMGASAYYPSIEYACETATAPVDDDIICISNASDHDYGATTTITLGADVIIISVDDANCDQYSPGAIERNGTTGANRNLTISGVTDGIIRIFGVHFITAQTLTFYPIYGTTVLSDCELETLRTGSAGLITFGVSAASAWLFNVALTFPTSNNRNQLTSSNGANVYLCGCVVTGDFAFYGGIIFTSGDDGGSWFLDSCDFGACTNLDYIVSHSAFFSVSDYIHVEVNNCALPDGTEAFDLATHDSASARARISGSGSLGNQNEFNDYSFPGTAEHDEVTYRAATFDGANEFSVLISTTADCSFITPYRYKIYAANALDLSSETTISVSLTGKAALLQRECWIEVAHTGDGNLVEWLRSTRPSDVWGGSGDVANEASAGWTSGGTEDYEITETIPAQTGVTNGYVEVWICVAYASADLNFDLPVLT